jgi:preprotein translocase subunit SecG
MQSTLRLYQVFVRAHVLFLETFILLYIFLVTFVHLSYFNSEGSMQEEQHS